MNPDVINYAFGVIGIIIGIVGLVLAVRSIKKKDPVYLIKSINLIKGYSSRYENLQVSYANRAIENLTVTTIAFYNRGSDVINREDIVNIEPLRIVGSNNVEILDAKI